MNSTRLPLKKRRTLFSAPVKRPLNNNQLFQNSCRNPLPIARRRFTVIRKSLCIWHDTFNRMPLPSSSYPAVMDILWHYHKGIAYILGATFVGTWLLICPKMKYHTTVSTVQSGSAGKRPWKPMKIHTELQTTGSYIFVQRHTGRPIGTQAQLHLTPLAAKVPHVCEVCANSFASSSGLKEHISTFHQPREKGLVQCSQCSKWLMNNRCLKIHM